MKHRLTLIALYLSLVAGAAPITFTWDHPEPNAVGGYRVYGQTNNVTAFKIDTGTNRIVTVDNMIAGIWKLWVTTYVKNTNTDNTISVVESLPSEAIAVIVPQPPTNTAVLAVQWIGTLASTNWTDVGFFRLKIGLP